MFFFLSILVLIQSDKGIDLIQKLAPKNQIYWMPEREVKNYKHHLKIITCSQGIFISEMKTGLNGKQTVVCMTGFTQHPKLHLYREQISSLGCKYIQQLAEGTDILLVDNVSTEKYKIAKLKKNMTECLTIKWLEDSIKAKKLLSITPEYQLSEIFYNLHIGLYNLPESHEKSLRILLQKNGAHVYNLTNQAVEYDLLHVIVSRRNQLRRLGTIQVEIPVVGIDWIEESVKAGLCKYPPDYAMNFSSRTSIGSSGIARLKKKLAVYSHGALLDSNHQFLGDFTETVMNPTTKKPSVLHHPQCVVFCHANSLEPLLMKTLKKLICVTGGLFLNNINPSITHILVGSITEEEYGKLLGFGDYVEVVRVEWLIDSILFAQRLDEVDYRVRCFRRKWDDGPSNQVSQGYGSDSLTFPQQSIMQSLQADRKSISNRAVINTECKMVVKKEQKCRQKKTTIFKNKYFIIDSTQRKKDRQMQGIFTKIQQNNGEISNKPVKGHLTYVVLNDSPSNEPIMKEFLKTGRELMAVSYRWVNYCISKSQFLAPTLPGYYIFRPFTFSTPCSELMLMKIQIVGMENQIDKIRLVEVLGVLGSGKISPNKAEVTHCLCGVNWKSDKKMIGILRQNQSVKLVKIEWLEQWMQGNRQCWQEYEIHAEKDIDAGQE